MKLWFDTEFIEDGNTIDLVSIGIIREDLATYYAEIEEADLSRADDWVKENVLTHLRGEKKSRAQVAQDIVEFAGPSPEWWAYYADYDWVVLCQLFGRMIDLPENWPMYCRDVKQFADLIHYDLSYIPNGTEHYALSDAIWCFNAYTAVKNAFYNGGLK